MPAEHIMAAALKIGELIVFMPPPARHAHVIHEANRLGFDARVSCDCQAFVTSTGRFVDRAEAYQIAVAAGQQITRRPGGYDGPDLYSEDLW